MKLFSIAFVSLLIINTFLINPSEIFGQQPGASEQELITLSTQWNEAVERKDEAALEQLLADEFYVSSPGDLKPVNRSEWIKNAVELDWHNMRFNNLKVDFYGDTAIVTGLLEFRVTTKSGIPVVTNSQVTDVWIKRNGRWQVASRHLGSTSIGSYIRLGAGFAAGLGLSFLLWLFLRLKKRLLANKKPAKP
jgi:ketosteroid isomerase-like protein